MSGPKPLMNRKQASAVNSSEDACSAELVLMTQYVTVVVIIVLTPSQLVKKSAFPHFHSYIPP